MGRTLVEQLPAAQALFAEAERILGYDLAAMCLEGPAEQLNSTVHSQPALFVTSLAALESLRQTQPEVCERAAGAAGLSLGEYTALVFAGALPFADGLRLVRERGAAMQAAAEEAAGGMVAVLGLQEDQVSSVCDAARNEGEILQVANLLCPGNIAVSGHAASLARVPEHAEAAGAMRSVPLAVAGAFHTPLMLSAADRLSQALRKAPFANARIPVWANVDARPHQSAAEFPDLLMQQLTAPVRWQQTIEAMLAEGFDGFYEVGPGRVLKGLLKRIDRRIACESVID
jgi:[acyl-carrier-protein] S-malonyltransferase